MDRCLASGSCVIWVPKMPSTPFKTFFVSCHKKPNSEWLEPIGKEKGGPLISLQQVGLGAHQWHWEPVPPNVGVCCAPCWLHLQEVGPLKLLPHFLYLNQRKSLFPNCSCRCPMTEPPWCGQINKSGPGSHMPEARVGVTHQIL